MQEMELSNRKLSFCKALGYSHAVGGCGGKEEGSGVYAARNVVIEQDMSYSVPMAYGEGRGQNREAQ
jgi:hypothetical protein